MDDTRPPSPPNTAPTNRHRPEPRRPSVLGAHTTVGRVRQASFRFSERKDSRGTWQGWFLVACFVFGAGLMATAYGVALAIWPDCADDKPCEDRESSEKMLARFAKEVVPQLQAHTPDFTPMGQAMFETTRSQNCIAPVLSFLEGQLGGFVSDPAEIRQIVQYMSLENVTVIREILGSLWYEPQEYSASVNQTSSCMQSNGMLMSYLCAVLDDSIVAPALKVCLRYCHPCGLHRFSRMDGWFAGGIDWG